jgi:hypothetical protein
MACAHWSELPGGWKPRAHLHVVQELRDRLVPPDGEATLKGELAIVGIDEGVEEGRGEEDDGSRGTVPREVDMEVEDAARPVAACNPISRRPAAGQDAHRWTAITPCQRLPLLGVTYTPCAYMLPARHVVPRPRTHQRALSGRAQRDAGGGVKAARG